MTAREPGFSQDISGNEITYNIQPIECGHGVRVVRPSLTREYRKFDTYGQPIDKPKFSTKVTAWIEVDGTLWSGHTFDLKQQKFLYYSTQNFARKMTIEQEQALLRAQSHVAQSIIAAIKKQGQRAASIKALPKKIKVARCLAIKQNKQLRKLFQELCGDSDQDSNNLEQKIVTLSHDLLIQTDIIKKLKRELRDLRHEQKREISVSVWHPFYYPLD